MTDVLYLVKEIPFSLSYAKGFYYEGVLSLPPERQPNFFDEDLPEINSLGLSEILLFCPHS